MGRYSPTVLPSEEERPGVSAFLSELSRGPERLHQIRGDRRAREEYEYAKSQRPIEEAVRTAQLRELGIVPHEEPTLRPAEGPPPIAAFDQPAQPAAREIPTERMGPAGNPSMRPAALEPFVNELAPTPQVPSGAFNPMTGGFTPPRPMSSRIPLNRQYDIEETLTPQGRALARAADDAQQLKDAGIPAGLAEYAAHHPENSQQLLSSFFEKKTRGWQPGSHAEAVQYWRETQGSIPRGDRAARLLIPMDKAFAQIDQMFGTWVGDEFHSRLNPEARTRLAEELARTGKLPPGTPKMSQRQLRELQNARFGDKDYTPFSGEEVEGGPPAEPAPAFGMPRRDTTARRGTPPAAPPAAPPAPPGARGRVMSASDRQQLQNLVNGVQTREDADDVREALRMEGLSEDEINSMFAKRQVPAVGTVGQPR